MDNNYFLIYGKLNYVDLNGGILYNGNKIRLVLFPYER